MSWVIPSVIFLLVISVNPTLLDDFPWALIIIPASSIAAFLYLLIVMCTWATIEEAAKHIAQVSRFLPNRT